MPVQAVGGRRREMIATYLEPADAALLRALAHAAERSIAGEIRIALRDHLHDAEPAPGPGKR